jgi:hypothetical protein
MLLSMVPPPPTASHYPASHHTATLRQGLRTLSCSLHPFPAASFCDTHALSLSLSLSLSPPPPSPPLLLALSKDVFLFAFLMQENGQDTLREVVGGLEEALRILSELESQWLR